MQTKAIIIGLIIGLVIGLAVGFGVQMGAVRTVTTTVTAPGAPATVTETKTVTAAAPACPVSLDVIKKRGKLVVATDATWPPWEWVKDGKFVGWDVDIAGEIAKKLGVDLEIRDVRFAGIFELVRRGEVDMAISAITWTTEREKIVSFTMPYYLETIVVVTLAERTDINKVEDLYGKKVGVQIGTTHEEWAAESLEKPGKAQVARYDKAYPHMYMALKRGDVDAIILDRSIAEALKTKFPELRIAFELPGSAGYISIAVPKCADDLRYFVNTVIEELMQTGKLKEVMDRNFELFLKG